MATPSRAARGVAAALLLAGLLAGLLASAGLAVSQGNLASVGDPLLLPGILIVCWVALAGLILWRESRRTAGTTDPDPGRTWSVILVCLLGGAAVAPFGMLLAVAFTTPAVLWLCGERSFWRLLGVATALGPGLWFLFHHVFLIRLPSLLSGGLL